MLAAANLIFCYLRLNVSFSAHIMQGVTVLVLVFMWCTQTVYAQEGQWTVFGVLYSTYHHRKSQWKVRSWWLLKVQRLKDYWLTKGIAGTCQEHTTWNTCKTRQHNIHSVVQVHLQLSHWGKEGRHLESSSAIIFDLIRSWSISLKQFTDGHII